MEKLLSISKKFPNAPGVYFWLDSAKKPIYIGRAGSLKKRIASYFRTKDPRIAEMVGRARGLKFQQTDTLLEAVVLEANLIKKFWPKYNVKDKDNRSFVYLAILKGDFPKPIVIRGRDTEKYPTGRADLFGPYQSYRLLKTSLELVRKVFPFSTCVPNSDRACFHYQIGLCPGVCIGAVSPSVYQQNIKNLKLFFRGEKKRLLASLKKSNPEKIKSLQHVADTALLAGADTLVNDSTSPVYGRIEGYDISHLAGREAVGSMVVFENGESDNSQYRLFKVKGAAKDDLGMLREVMARRLAHTEWQTPDIVFVDGGVLQVKTVQKELAKRNLFIPVVGLSKAGKHAGSAYATDKLVAVNAKKIGKELLISSKKLFQEVRNEAHRFAVSFNRRRRSLSTGR